MKVTDKPEWIFIYLCDVNGSIPGRVPIWVKQHPGADGSGQARFPSAKQSPPYEIARHQCRGGHEGRSNRGLATSTTGNTNGGVLADRIPGKFVGHPAAPAFCNVRFKPYLARIVGGVISGSGAHPQTHPLPFNGSAVSRCGRESEHHPHRPRTERGILTMPFACRPTAIESPCRSKTGFVTAFPFRRVSLVVSARGDSTHWLSCVALHYALPGVPEFRIGSKLLHQRLCKLRANSDIQRATTSLLKFQGVCDDRLAR